MQEEEQSRPPIETQQSREESASIALKFLPIVPVASIEPPQAELVEAFVREPYSREHSHSEDLDIDQDIQFDNIQDVPENQFVQIRNQDYASFFENQLIFNENQHDDNLQDESSEFDENFYIESQGSLDLDDTESSDDESIIRGGGGQKRKSNEQDDQSADRSDDQEEEEDEESQSDYEKSSKFLSLFIDINSRVYMFYRKQNKV